MAQTPEVASACRNAIRFQAWAALLMILAFITTNVIIGYALVATLAILVCVLTVAAGLSALAGISYSYHPFVPRTVSWRLSVSAVLALAAAIPAALFGFRHWADQPLHIDATPRPNPQFQSEGWSGPDAQPMTNTIFPYAELASFVYGAWPGNGQAGENLGEARCYSSGFHWQSRATFSNPRSGFYSELFEAPDGSLTLAFRGTEGTVADFLTDMSMALGIVPQQFRDAERALAEVKSGRQGPDRLRMLTGHSLGGAIAQWIAARNNLSAITFNPFGTAHMLSPAEIGKTREKTSPPQILNVVQSTDIVSNAAVSFTLAGIWESLRNTLLGTPAQHPGCMGQYVQSADVLDLVGWHSISKLANELLVTEFSAPESYQIHACHDVLPAWHLPARWMCGWAGPTSWISQTLQDRKVCSKPKPS